MRNLKMRVLTSKDIITVSGGNNLMHVAGFVTLSLISTIACFYIIANTAPLSKEEEEAYFSIHLINSLNYYQEPSHEVFDPLNGYLYLFPVF